MLSLVKIQILFSSQLADSIRTNWMGGMVFGRRKGVLFSVYRPARRRKDNTLALGLPRTFKNIEQSKNIHSCIKQWIGNRATDIHLRRMMIDHLNPFVNQEPPHCCI